VRGRESRASRLADQRAERRPGAVDGLLVPARRELCDKVGGRDEQEDVQAAQEDSDEKSGDEPGGPRAADRRQGFEDWA
jgi:hypothetical protein